jgi:hypothetical protein
MRNPKIVLAFVTSKDEEEEFMMAGYYRFFLPFVAIDATDLERQQSCKFGERNRTGKIVERESMNLLPHFPQGLGFSGLASSLYKTSRHQWWV